MPKKLCKIDSCPKDSFAREMCQGHYKRLKKYGDPLAGGTPRSTQTDPYLKVMERVTVDPDGCWEWTGSQESFGHGNIKVNGKNVKVHRVVYQHHHGELSSDVLVRHTCDNPPCVRPDHLIPGTYADNNRDMADRGRSPSGADHWTAKQRT